MARSIKVRESTSITVVEADVVVEPVQDTATTVLPIEHEAKPAAKVTRPKTAFKFLVLVALSLTVAATIIYTIL